MTGRHAERQKTIGAIEPLLIVVDQSVRRVTDQKAGNRDTGIADLRLAGDDAPDAGIAAIGSNQEIDAVDPICLSVLCPGDRYLAVIGAIAADVRDVAAITHERSG